MVLVAMMAVLPLLSPMVASAQQDGDGATPPTTVPTPPTTTSVPVAPTPGPVGPPALELLDQDPWIGPRGTFHVKLRVVTPAEGYSLEARVFRALDDVADILDTTADDPSTRSLGRFVRRAVPAGTVTEELEAAVVPEADGTFGDPFVLDPGIYPVQVLLLDPAGERVDTTITHLVHLPDSLAADPVPLALLADLRVDPSRAVDGRARPDAEEIDHLQRQLDALDALGTVPLHVQLYPETVSALSGTRAGLGGAALASLERLAGQRATPGGAHVVSGTFVGFNESAWVADGHIDVLRAELDAGRVTVSGSDLRADTGTAALQGPADGAVLTWLHELGADRVIEAQPPAAPEERRALATFGGAPRQNQQQPEQLVLPPATSVLPPPASTDGDYGVADAHRLLAALLFAPLSGDGRALQVRLDGRPGGVDFEGGFTTTLLEALAAPGPLEIVDLERIFADTAHHDAPFDPPAPAGPAGSSGARGDQLADISRRVAGLRSLLGSDEVTAGLEARLLLVPASGIDDADAAALVAGVDESIEAVTRSVVVPETQAFTVTSHRSSLPVVLRNETERPLQIMLTLSSSEIEFTGDNPLRVTLQPGANDLEIDIQTRRSGEFDFQVLVSSPDGGLRLGDIQISVLSRAISGVGLFLSGGALTFLVVWWVRNARKRRRVRHEARRQANDPTEPNEARDTTQPAPAGTAVPGPVDHDQADGIDHADHAVDTQGGNQAEGDAIADRLRS